MKYVTKYTSRNTSVYAPQTTAHRILAKILPHRLCSVRRMRLFLIKFGFELMVFIILFDRGLSVSLSSSSSSCSLRWHAYSLF